MNYLGKRMIVGYDDQWTVQELKDHLPRTIRRNAKIFTGKFAREIWHSPEVTLGMYKLDNRLILIC